MKKQFFLYLNLILAGVVLYSCQDLERPELGDFPLDGPQLNLISPSVEGGTVIQTLEETGAVTLNFNATDDLGIASISVQIDGNEVINLSNFVDNTNVSFTELTHEGVQIGMHTLAITVTDTDDNIATASTSFEMIQGVGYTPLLASEFFYMPFDGDYNELISLSPATPIGSPGFNNNTFVTTADSYINFPINQLSQEMPTEFSGAFWYKVSGDPGRAGIIVVGDDASDRNQGFRLFREGSATSQTLKLNIGTGGSDSWNNGGSIDVTADEWVHVAFTISSSETKIYLNGNLENTGNSGNPIDWTGAEDITIGSGGPTFNYWNHNSDAGSQMNDLRFFNTALTAEDISTLVALGSKTMELKFEGDYTDNISGNMATAVGPVALSSDAFDGNNAFMGATDAYLTYPFDALNVEQEMSIVFQYNVNSDPTRAGLIVINDNDDRQQGIRLFREGNADSQTIKLNVGIGSGESWNNGGAIDATTGDWVQVALTLSATESKIYLDGVLQNTATLSAPVDWTDCQEMFIGSGGPTFSYWNHLSDLSLIDNLSVFNVTLTESQIQEMQ